MNVAKTNQYINEKVKKYSFSQAIRVILFHLRDIYGDIDHEQLYKKIQFEGNVSLSFQKSDIDYIKFYEDEIAGKRVEISLNFLNLFGSSSPMPSHYNETVLRSYEDEDDKVLYDFLNLFNHNLQKFIYPIWEKQRYYIKYNKTLNDGFSKYILAILGLYANFNLENNKLDFQKIMPYIGVLSMRQKSAGTITSILRHYLGFNEVEIQQCIKMQSNIPAWQNPKLGDKNTILGEDLTIGTFVINKTSKFRIVLKDVRVDDMLKYSIHGNKMDELNDLISFAFNEPLEYDVCLEIKEENKVHCIFNEEKKRYLGINCWIGEKKDDEQIIIAQKG